MAYQLFQYPLPGPVDLSELNACLATHRVVSVAQHLVSTAGGGTLVVVVQTVDSPTRPGSSAGASGPARKIDYREELSPEDFEVFSRLRDERKKLAEAEGVPVYAIFTNDQLATMAKTRPATLAGISSIEGIGKARVDKHGPRFLTLCTAQPSALSISQP